MAQRQAPAAKQTPPPGKDAPRTRSFLRDDFPFIRKASITLGACIVLSVALVSGSSFLLSRQKDSKNQAQAQHNIVREKFTQADLEKREIREFQPKYVQLLARGIVGEEKRLDWIERIRHIQEDRKLLPLTYEISAQQPFQVDPTLQTGELELRGSRMQLKMDLLHEMDLLNLLNDLRAKQFYVLQECAIQQATAAGNAPLSPRLTADCTLFWVTMGYHTAATGDTAKAAGQ